MALPGWAGRLRHESFHGEEWSANRHRAWSGPATQPSTRRSGPLWNKNQGNIYAAKGQFGEAVNEVGRVQNDLVGRLAASDIAGLMLEDQWLPAPSPPVPAPSK